MLPQIIIKDYKLFNVIGKGSFGEVYLTKKGDNPEYLATKRIDSKYLKNPFTKKYLINEISILKELNHPNIIRLIDFIQSSNHSNVIMEYCNGGSLSQILEQYGKPFPIEIIQYFMRQIVDGLKYIHSKNIIHRDIKLDNILVNFKTIEDKNNLNLLSSEIKIIDFGLSIKLGEGENANTYVGSPINMDPIILNKYKKAGGFEKLLSYNEKADIWSLGTICYKMLTSYNPFNEDNIEDLIEKIKQGYYNIPTNINLSKEIISFINGMLQYQGEFRLTAEELSQHDFLIKNVNEFTPINLQDISDKMNGINIFINSKKNTTIWKIFNNKDRNKKEEFKKYINGLLNEYNSALNYLKDNNLINQEQEINNKYILIKNEKDKLELGNLVDFNDLPKPINPEDIYGCSTNERNNKYNEIYNKYINDKNFLETKINSYDRFSLQINIKLKKEFEKDSADLEKLVNDLKKIENYINNIWAPAPKYIKELKKFQEESIYNYNLIKIQIKKIDDTKENLKLLITFKNRETIRFIRDVELKNQNNFSEKWTWTIFGNEWKNIENYYLKIENNKNILNNNTPNKIKINIGKIKNGKPIAFNCLIPESNNEKIYMNIIPVILEGKKCFAIEEKEVINIKIFPPFKGKSLETEKIPVF